MLFPVYAALAAALVFYLLIPIIGGFMLRSQWRRFRSRVEELSLAPRLRYRDIAEAARSGRAEIGRFRLRGTIEALEGGDRVWVRGQGVSALVDLSRAPLYVLSPGPAEAGSIQRMRWSSVSSLVEGTSIFVAGLLVLERGSPAFVDRADEPLIAVCHEHGEERLITRIIIAGRAPNEYWNYPTRISLALGLVAISAILLLFRASAFSTVRAFVFLVGAIPVLPFAPPGLAFFFGYLRLWRRALSSRVERDLGRLPLRYASGVERAPTYARRAIGRDERPPADATTIGARALGRHDAVGSEASIYEPIEASVDPDHESFIIAGDLESLVNRAERDAFLYAAVSGLSFGLAIVVNFTLAFLIWRSAL